LPQGTGCPPPEGVGTRGAGAVRPRPRSRDGLRERCDGLVAGAPLRRGQAVGLRAGARRPRHPGALQREDGMGERGRQRVHGQVGV